MNISTDPDWSVRAVSIYISSSQLPGSISSQISRYSSTNHASSCVFFYVAFQGQLFLKKKKIIWKPKPEIVQNRVGENPQVCRSATLQRSSQSYNYDALRFSCPLPLSYHVVLLHQLESQAPRVSRPFYWRLYDKMPTPLHNCVLKWFYKERSR